MSKIALFSLEPLNEELIISKFRTHGEIKKITAKDDFEVGYKLNTKNAATLTLTLTVAHIIDTLMTYRYEAHLIRQFMLDAGEFEPYSKQPITSSNTIKSIIDKILITRRVNLNLT